MGSSPAGNLDPCLCGDIGDKSPGSSSMLFYVHRDRTDHCISVGTGELRKATSIFPTALSSAIKPAGNKADRKMNGSRSRGGSDRNGRSPYVLCWCVGASP